VKDEISISRRVILDMSATTPARPACVAWSARSPRSAARRQAHLLNKSKKHVHVNRRTSRSISACAFATARPRKRTASVRSPGLRGRKSAAIAHDRDRQRCAGQGQAHHTGQLGDVMQESIQAAMTVVRAVPRRCASTPDFYQKLDMHVHVPEGATPKTARAPVRHVYGAGLRLTGIPVRAMWP
jgi:hypothetical protein